MRGWTIVAAAGLLLVPVAGEAAMPLPVFLAKAEALQRKGMLALFSSDLSTLKNEVRSAMGSLRAERLAAKAAGKPQAYCPPQDSGSMNSDELLAALRQIPPAQRARMDVKDGMRTILARKFPCRA